MPLRKVSQTFAVGDHAGKPEAMLGANLKVICRRFVPSALHIQMPGNYYALAIINSADMQPWEMAKILLDSFTGATSF